jgi:hypothetical protein
VDHGHPRAAKLELEGFRETRGIQVSPDGLHGRVSGELLEERRIHEVPGVQDEVGAPEVRGQALRQGSGAAWYVRVGDDGGEQLLSRRPPAIDEQYGPRHEAGGPGG